MPRPPVRAQFTGIAFLVPSRDHATANRHYTVGDWYNMAEFDERSKEEHGQFFAVLAEVWAQWPEADREIYKDDIRRFRCMQLIELGYCTREYIITETEGEMGRWMLHFGRHEPYTIIEVRGNVMEVTRAESMRVERKPGDGGMPRKRFNAAKNACFEHWANALDSTVEMLTANSQSGRHKKATAA